jgi:hypothetical protein
MNKQPKTTELTNAIFKQSIDLSGISDSIYPKYKLINGGEVIQVQLNSDKYKSLYIQHIGPDGILCNDEAETFIKWEMFS